MARGMDQIVALHIGGLALELCRQVKINEDLKEEQLKVEAAKKENVDKQKKSEKE